jgi:hypothetical protein
MGIKGNSVGNALRSNGVERVEGDPEVYKSGPKIVTRGTGENETHAKSRETQR